MKNNCFFTEKTDYPFGMLMPGRSVTLGGYRFGVGGFEKDNEVSGEGNHLAFGDYGYDPRTGRRWQIDPLTHKAPSWSPYRVFFNNPILFKDPDGHYELPATVQKQYPMFTAYIKSNIAKDVMGSKTILNAFSKNTAADNPNGLGNLTAEEVKKAVTWNSGPAIIVRENPGGLEGANGYYNSSTGQIELSKSRMDELEKVLSGVASPEAKQKALSAVYMTVLHETTHYGDNLDGLRQDGGEPGEAFEDDVWRTKTVEVDGQQIPDVRYTFDDKYDPAEMQKIMDEKMQTTEGKKTFPTLPAASAPAQAIPKKQ